MAPFCPACPPIPQTLSPIPQDPATVLEIIPEVIRTAPPPACPAPIPREKGREQKVLRPSSLTPGNRAGEKVGEPKGRGSPIKLPGPQDSQAKKLFCSQQRPLHQAHVVPQCLEHP